MLLTLDHKLFKFRKTFSLWPYYSIIVLFQFLALLKYLVLATIEE